MCLKAKSLLLLNEKKPGMHDMSRAFYGKGQLYTLLLKISKKAYRELTASFHGVFTQDEIRANS